MRRASRELEDAWCAAASRGRAACIGVVWVAERSSSRGVGDGRGPRGSWLLPLKIVEKILVCSLDTFSQTLIVSPILHIYIAVPKK